MGYGSFCVICPKASSQFITPLLAIMILSHSNSGDSRVPACFVCVNDVSCDWICLPSCVTNNLFWIEVAPCCSWWSLWNTCTLWSCEASRFDLNMNWTILIGFESDGPILPSYHKPRSIFNKKTSTIEIYFMFMTLCLCSKSIYSCNIV